eukprot:g14806.t1
MMPVYILLPAVISRWTSNSTPWALAMRFYPWRVLLVLIAAVLVSCTPSGDIHWTFYLAVVVVYLLGAVVSQNTLANLGGMWPSTVTLKLIDATSCSSPSCAVKVDGFYIMSGLSFFYGLLWYIAAAGPAHRVQMIKLSDWRL